ncbi:MAG: putative metal-dependent rane protease [Francisellaceae bacterium]|nr:putative metal-dependent rane protease [Francisellaceae bacterium]
MRYSYQLFLNQPLLSLTYLSLSLSILTTWCKRVPYLWMFFLSASMLLAFYLKQVHFAGLIFLINCGFITACIFKIEDKTYKLVANLLFFISAFLLYFHLTHQAIHNWLVIPKMKLSSNTYPLDMYLNLDKPLIGLFLLGFANIPLKGLSEIIKAIRNTYVYMVLGITLILGLGIHFNFMQWDPKLPTIFGIWALNNLLLVCITEEVLFRGFIQGKLSLIFNSGFGRILSLLIASFIFALSHYQGGQVYMILAGLAGLMFGFIYYKTQSIEASIFAHFVLNVIHFLFFSYPAMIH